MPSLFRAHRQALARRLPEGLILLAAAPEILRNGDVHFRYRQASDFLYLTGVEEPGYALLLDPARGAEALFVPKLTGARGLDGPHPEPAGGAGDLRGAAGALPRGAAGRPP